MIVDASVVVAGVLADQRHGEWALEVLLRGRLAAPHLMPVEVTQMLRRDVIRGSVTARDADVAMGDLARLPIDLYPFEPVAATGVGAARHGERVRRVVRRPGRGSRRTSRHARHAAGAGARSAVCVSRPRVIAARPSSRSCRLAAGDRERSGESYAEDPSLRVSHVYSEAKVTVRPSVDVTLFRRLPHRRRAVATPVDDADGARGDGGSASPDRYATPGRLNLTSRAA